MSNVNTGGLVRETLYQPGPPPLNIGAVIRETLYSPPIPDVHVAGLVRETLYPGFAIVKAVVFL